tara:strand:- start:5641 stop:6300 length:660 start_codon:yes stop_codon:yes gene_type:complete
MTEIIGHRGLPTYFNDNSLTGIIASQEHSNAVEIDLRLTKDEEILLFHDAEIDGVSVPSRTLEELIMEFPEYNLKDHHLVSRHQLGNHPVFFEIKTDGLEESQKSLLKRKALSMAQPTDTIICFDWDLVFEIRNDTTSKYGIHIANEEQLFEAKSISMIDKSMYFMVYADLIEARVFDLPINKVVAWTVNDIHLAKRLIQMEINGIITDIPEELITLLK